MKKDKVAGELIQVARKVFSKYGYKKTTLDDIAREAGRGKTSLYYYFKSKEEIFKAVIEKEAAIIVQTLTDAISSEAAAESKLHAYILARMKSMKGLTEFYEEISRELFDHLSFIDESRKGFDAIEVMLIKQILSDGIESKKFRKLDTESVAMDIVLVLKGLELQLLIYSKNINVEEKLKGIIDILINGIKKFN